jgi:adenylate cyclase
MEGLAAYLPIDRRLALAGKKSLPDRAEGTALFADISGFTALTEALARSLGPRRGAEELSTVLNLVYETLVAEVERFQGSVIAFAGDAITCWFDGDDGRRAAVAALGMETAMARFANLTVADGEPRSLAVKTAAARGPVRRFLVGNPNSHFLDVAAGHTLNRMAQAASVALRNEVVLDASIVQALGSDLVVKEWRPGKESGEKFAVVSRYDGKVDPSHWPEVGALDEASLRPYLLRPVFDRLHAGQGDFLTELRPAVALFLHFGGLDHDHDPAAGQRLSEYVDWVQEVVARFGGFLLLVATGDKGSHLYCCFGAPVAHENNAWRAVSAAHELCRPPVRLNFVTGTRIGVSSGTMRTGAYGSNGRRTYGVLGDDVNLAARLMEAAAPGQVLVSEQVRRVVGEAFVWQGFAPVTPKGKTSPIAVFASLGPAGQDESSLLEPQYALPLVGRAHESSLIRDRLDSALKGKGQVLNISAEAGMGKSRLVVEAIRLARERGLTVHVGQCLSHGVNTSYLAWRSIWRGLFDLRSTTPAAEQIARVETRILELDPALQPRLPLLAPVLNLPIPENEVTAPLEAKLRKSSLENLLVDCLRKLARDAPLLLVVEDVQWIDALSEDLVDAVARMVNHSRVLLLLTHRPQEVGVSGTPNLQELPHFSEILLTSFTTEEAERLVQLKLQQLYDLEGPPPPQLVALLISRAAGNPFYLEELINYLRDQKIDLQNPDAVGELDLPDSLRSLVLSRVDKLTQTQQAALKVASVVGRLFPAAVIWGVQSQVDRQRVSNDLARLCEVDLMALDRPEPELFYIFKHVITQQVTYESLPEATRARLHGEIGSQLEQFYVGNLEQNLDLLAFHFDRSLNAPKKLEYLKKAGESAQANYANAAALSYYERLLPLLSDTDRPPVLLQVGKVFELVGDWKSAGASYQRAFEAADRAGLRVFLARSQAATGDLLRKQGLLSEATDWFDIAKTAFEELDDHAGVGQTLHGLGTVAAMQGNYERARSLYEQSLQIRQQLGDKAQMASLANNLGIIARFQTHYELARKLAEQSLQLRREIGDRPGIANSLNNLGMALRDLAELGLARSLLEESLSLSRQVGDRWAVANTLSSLAEVALDQSDWTAARGFLNQSLQMNLDLGDRTAVAFILECFAAIAAGRGEPRPALVLAGAACGLREKLGSPLSPSEQSRLDHYLASARQSLAAAEQTSLFNRGQALTMEQALAEWAALYPQA